MEECLEEASSETLKTKQLDLSRENILDIPKDIVFPNELNHYLKDQLQYYLHENTLLQKRLTEYDTKLTKSEEKIGEYSNKVREYEILCGKNEFITSTAIAANKIVELSKKLREKTSELEVYKTKCSKLEHNLFQLKEEFQSIEKPEIVEAPPQNELVEQVKLLQEKLNSTKTKLIETRNQNSQLKNDLKLANKWLQQETGDNFENLANIHNSNSNWRGRAQIICDLQKKNSDLREQLKSINQDKVSPSDVSATSAKLEKKLNTFMQENIDLKKTIEEFKKKYDSVRARIKCLESESVVMKGKISRMNEQNDRYRQEIESLRKQLTVEKETKDDIAKQRESLMHKFYEEKQKLKIELEKKECVLQNLTKQIEERNEEMDTLKSKVRGSRPPSSYGTKQTKTIVDDKTIGRLEAERLRLLELTELQNRRLENERTHSQKTESELRYERQKAAKLEAKLARIELEHSSKSSTYSTSIATSRESELEILRNQFELAQENIKALNTRLEIEKHERKIDWQQFASILKNHENDNSNSFEQE